MARKGQAKKTQISETLEGLDAIIEKEAKTLGLTPTNLLRGNLVSDAVSTGSLALDLILGGGWAPGRRSNVFGREQSGKSTLMYFAVKAAISQGIHCLFFDWEGSTDADRIERIGVQADWAKELKAEEPVLFRYYDRMHSGEQMFRVVRRILEQLPDKEEGKVQLAIFLDSLPTVLPEDQADNDESGANALRARLFSEMLPLVKSQLAAKRCILIDVNQLRTKPGFTMGNPEYEPCGEAVRTQSDCRVKAKKTIAPTGRGKVRSPKGESKYIEVEKCWNGAGEDRYNMAFLSVIKNKAFSPFRSCFMRIWYEEAGRPGRGIDPVYDTYEYLRLTGQVRFVKSLLWIDIPPFNQEREVQIPVWDSKKEEYKVESIDEITGEVKYKMKTETRVGWEWMDFKRLILDPSVTKGKGRKKFDIIAACRQQIDDESGFKMYFENTSRLRSSKDDDDDEE